ncbi:MAG: helix-turn-helix transcriptional regulator [Anaerovoracaceae bacterium]|jgi:predicted DNA-binding transcriptional regulator YafY
MEKSNGSKKLALIRILQILQKYSDSDHALTQAEIAGYLEKDYGIVIERKAVSRNIALLKEAGFGISSGRDGTALIERDFTDAELRMLIDSVLCSSHITKKQSENLIRRLSGLSSRYFYSNIEHIYPENKLEEWNKTDNQSTFYNIEMISEAVDRKLQIHYNYNKYGTDRKLHRSSEQYVSPYQLILHNQRYYLMAYSEYWGNMVYHRLDRITNMQITDQPAWPLNKVPGFETGIDFREISSRRPYMYSDKPQAVEFLADSGIVDQIIDWFGRDIQIEELPDNPEKVRVTLLVSTIAMEHWAVQYLDHVEVTKPAALRDRIRESLKAGLEKYN